MDTLKSGHLLYTGHFNWSHCNTNMYYFTPEKIRTLSSQLKGVHISRFHCTEDCKLAVRLQMQNTVGIVVIGQLDE